MRAAMSAAYNALGSLAGAAPLRRAQLAAPPRRGHRALPRQPRLAPAVARRAVHADAEPHDGAQAEGTGEAHGAPLEEGAAQVAEGEADLRGAFAALCCRALARAPRESASDEGMASGSQVVLSAGWGGWDAGEGFAAELGPVRRALKGFASVAGDGHGDDVPTQVPTTWLGALGAGSVHAFARDSEWLREHSLDEFYAEYAAAATDQLREAYPDFVVAAAEGELAADGERAEGGDGARPLGMRWTGAAPPRPRGACMNAGWLLNIFVHDQSEGSLLGLRGVAYVLMALSTSLELPVAARGSLQADLHTVADGVAAALVALTDDSALTDEFQLRTALGEARSQAVDAAAARLLAVAPAVFPRPSHNTAKSKAMGDAPVWGTPPKNTEVRPGDWECSECNYHNYGSREICYKCGMGERPPFAGWRDDKGRPWRQDASNSNARDGDWACEECGFNNFASRDKCLQCNTPIPDYAVEAAKAASRGQNRFNSKPGDWNCPDCGFDNFAFRTDCKRCGAYKPEGAGTDMDGGWGNGGGRHGSGDERYGQRSSFDDPRRDRGYDRRSGEERYGQRSSFDDPRRDRGYDRRSGEERYGQRSSFDDPRRRPGDWDCDACGFVGNFASRTECKRCGEPAPEGAGGGYDRGSWQQGGGARQASANRKPGDWDCDACGFEGNFASRSECFSCGAARPGGGERFQSRPGDWDCSDCGFSNFASRYECKRCGSEKPGGSAGWVDRESYENKRGGRASSYDTYDPSGKASRYGGGMAQADSSGGNATTVNYGDRNYGGNDRADWDCQDCGFSNFASRSECHRCHAPRDA